MNPLLLTDFYKVGHVFQYPKNTELVYSNWTPRKSRNGKINKMVWFGLQYFVKEYLITRFNRDFFDRPHDEVMAEYTRICKNTIGDLPSYEHISRLHKLGYLPVVIKSLPEGSRVNMRVPTMTIHNTLPEFYWLTNFLESLMSCVIWQATTSATIAYEYRKKMNEWAEKTGMPGDFVQWQGHDFSFRGMSSLESACVSGAGHLLSFTGTDTIPSILFLEKYYNANTDKELVGASVAATEHSVASAGILCQDFNEIEEYFNEELNEWIPISLS